MKTEPKIEISKVTLNIKGEKLHLSLEEAKELKLALEKLFPQPETHFIDRPTYPWRYWQYENVPYFSSGGTGAGEVQPVYCANLTLSNSHKAS